MTPRTAHSEQAFLSRVLAGILYKLVDHQPSQHLVTACGTPGAMGTINLVLLNLANYHVPCIPLLYLLF